MIELREIYKPIGDLVALAEEAITKPAALPSVFHDRLDKIAAEMEAISTAKPSRKHFVECAGILVSCLRKLFLARASLDGPRVTQFEAASGFFLPYVRADIFEAMHWEREQEKP